jgi:hypothetical protein
MLIIHLAVVYNQLLVSVWIMIIIHYGLSKSHIINQLKLIVRFIFYLEEQVKCGDAVRLEHALTKRNLHSEEIYQSMITKGQEISCYGHEGQGN